MYNPRQKLSGQSCSIGCPYKKVHFLAVLPPFTLCNVETRKNSAYTSPTLFGGVEKGLGTSELKKAPQMQMFRKTFVHDCSDICYKVEHLYS